LARWGPYYQGSAQDIDRSRRAPADDGDEYTQQRRDEQRELDRGRARVLFVRLERLRGEAARTRGPELVRAVACITWLVERCGSERTRGVRVGGEVTAPKLSRLAGEAFADEATKARAKAAPAVVRRAPSDAPPTPPPELQLSPEPRPDMTEREIIDALSQRAQERSAHQALIDRYVVAALMWLLARAPSVLRERERTKSAAEIRSDAESARLAIEEHGAELLRDAAWLWSAAHEATEETQGEPLVSFEQVCSALTARVKAAQERRAKEAALMRDEG
jgi:hypothetical protein